MEQLSTTYILKETFHICLGVLQGAPGVFINLINKLLHKYLYKGVVPYLNNMLIYLDDYYSHVKVGSPRNCLPKLAVC